MPVISNLDFNSLSAKINEYSRLEQAGAVFVGLIAVYVLHSVWSLYHPSLLPDDVAYTRAYSCYMRLS
jgi:hypothetical protein